MLNITTGALPVTVAAKDIIPFSNVRVRSHRADRACNCRCGWFVYNEGSGQIELVNNSDQTRVFEVHFNGNVSAATPGATVLAIMLNGEAVGGTEMDYTVVTADVYQSVSATTLIQVPCGASVTVAVANNGTDPVEIKQGNIIAKRLA